MQRNIKHISENDKLNNDCGVPIRLLGRSELKMHRRGASWSVRGASGVWRTLIELYKLTKKTTDWKTSKNKEPGGRDA